MAWPSGPLEVRVALDRPADPSLARQLVGIRVEFDTQYQTLGKAAVRNALPTAPQVGHLSVVAARFDPLGRSLILATDPHSREAVYSASLPLGSGTGEKDRIVYDLSGVSASWSPAGAEDSAPAWEGWWPELDPEASARVTRGSLEHERAFALLSRPGRLTLDTMVVLPKGRVRLNLAANGPLEATLNGENPAEHTLRNAEFQVESTGDPLPLYLTLRTGEPGRKTTLRVAYTSDGALGEVTLSRDRQRLSWAPPSLPETVRMEPPGFDLTGGNAAEGERVFYSEQAKCSNCHKIAGKGGEVGPDLSDRSGRLPIDVFRDIAEPSATIHPDFVAHTVALKDGRVFAGVVRAEDAETLRVTDTDATITRFPRSEISELRPSATSIMPVGLVGAIGEARVRDLLAFLIAPHPRKNDPSPQPSR